MEIEGDHSASSTSQGPSLDANESLASLSPPPFLHDSLDVFDLPSASHLADFDTPASPGPSSMHMSTSSESCSVSCYDIGLLLKSTPQSHVRGSCIARKKMAYFVYHVSSLLVKRCWASWLLKSSIIGQRKPLNFLIIILNSTINWLQAEALKSSHNRPELAIDNQLKGIREDKIAKNRTIIKHIASAIHLCGTQSIALRGHRDDSTSDSDNKGNFFGNT